MLKVVEGGGGGRYVATTEIGRIPGGQCLWSPGRIKISTQQARIALRWWTPAPDIQGLHYSGLSALQGNLQN